MKADTSHLTMDEKIEAAFEQMAIRVIERARQTRTPVIIWEDEQILKLTPDEMEARLNTRVRNGEGKEVEPESV